MMIEHLNLVVSDIQTSLRFYRAAFPHWQVRGGGEQDWYGVERPWVHVGDDNHYLTLNGNGSGENRDLTSNRLGLGHFAFVINNLSALEDRLSDAGFQPSKRGAAHPYRRNLYYEDADGFEIEFVEYLSDIPEQRNRYD
ncbi:VOC family protein [Aestuariibacter halophilus]|uniref:VOC family protein n=1 Tax=Fluctibacter halophilus TaxID=226011 RepID=A0ABS8G7G4_9ALTE|nr:VOC family protein [Aestuariibacter halophilus]MCC2616463.1 VOC family protein [Aestuariibacter halophilus]